MGRDETDLDRLRTGCDGRRKNIADVYQLGGRPATPGSAVAPGLTHSSSPYIILYYYHYIIQKSRTQNTVQTDYIILYLHLFFSTCTWVSKQTFTGY